MENTTIYSVDYFISKFQSIPEELWCCFDVGSVGRPRCANGHTFGDCGEGAESAGLAKIFRGLKITPVIYPKGFSFNEDWYGYLNYQAGDYDTYSRVAEQINNNNTNEYQQPTPKQRILAALHDIKAMQQPTEQPKERVVYKSVLIDSAVKKLQEETLTEN